MFNVCTVTDTHCSVVLYDSEETSISINQKLVDIGLAQWEEPDLPMPQLKQVPASKPAERISSPPSTAGSNNTTGANTQNNATSNTTSHSSKDNSTLNNPTLPKLNLEKTGKSFALYIVNVYM